MKFIYVDEYSEIPCVSCGEDDWGTFVEFPNGNKMCNNCLEELLIEVQVKELRDRLKSK